ncbi:uncharacterized protein LOC134196552 isoform X1 [Corticium candelabrum]|uniref:uncharacterized protein LOC134196552 isoform X1 n=1 Tax=Corticium candelabrum TaxID=121492 RepID=UPI002E2586E8|nr:uncharacterized protein LOC134196552 isoform X1 [Corticium candelabrum]
MLRAVLLLFVGVGHFGGGLANKNTCEVYNHDMKESVRLNYSCTSQKPGAKWHITFAWTCRKGLANVMNHCLHDIYCVRCIIATAHMRTWSIMWKDLFTFGDVQPSCKTLPKGTVSDSISLPAPIKEYVVWVSDLKRQTSAVTYINKCNQVDCDWSNVHKGDNSVEISSPKLKLVEDKVFLHFCVHIDDPSRADDFNNIVTVTLNTRPYGCNWKVPKVANVNLYFEAQVAVLKESCKQCSETPNIHCVTPGVNMAIAVNTKYNTQSSLIQLSGNKVPSPTIPSTDAHVTTSFPTRADQPIVTSSITPLIPTTAAVINTSLPTQTTHTNSNTSDLNSTNWSRDVSPQTTEQINGDDNTIPLAIGVSGCVVVIVLILVILARYIYPKVNPHQRSSPSYQKQSGKNFLVVVDEERSQCQNRVTNQRKEHDTSRELEAIVIYHQGNEQKAHYARNVVLTGLRDMGINCTAPQYETKINIDISRWVRDTLHNIQAVVAVCSEEFYDAFWSENKVSDTASAIIYEIASQIRPQQGRPLFISVITDSSEEKYIPDNFRIKAPRICLTSLDEFDRLVRLIRNVPEYQLPPLGVQLKVPSPTDPEEIKSIYDQSLELAWRKMVNIRPSYYTENDDTDSDSVISV